MKRDLHHSEVDRITIVVNYVILALLLFIVAYPLYYVMVSSFDGDLYSNTSGFLLFPKKPSVVGYEAVFRYKHVWSGYRNSLVYMILGTAVNLFVSVCAAYPLSRKDFGGRNVIMVIFVFTMYFSGGLIPTYLLVRSLGLLDKLGAMVLPGALSVYNMIVMRTYFATQIPDELLEASQLDGCRNTRFLVSVVLPLSGPILAVIGLFYAVGHWNSYFAALIYLNSANKYPLQIVLREILIMNSVNEAALADMDPEQAATMARMRELLKYSLIVVASVPVLCLYPFVQKYFVKGMMIGSIKG